MARVDLAADRLSAVLRRAAGEALTLDALRALLASAGVHHGLLREALGEATRPAPAAGELTIAVGEAALGGEPAVIDHLIDTLAHPPSVGRSAGDLHRPRWLVEVAAGAELARLHPGRPPRPGRDVTGATLPAAPAPAVDLAAIAGDGTRVLPGPEPVLVAGRAGAYERAADGRIVVRPEVVVAGDLDHTCGDIVTSLPVTIRGDVRSGFALRGGADVAVTGAIEDALVQVGGNLTVGGGIVAGAQRVTVHGRLGARHIMGRAVRAESIALAGAAIDAGLVAATTLSCTALIGGHAFAGREASCDQLGDESETTTRIDLGGHPFLAALADEARAEQASLCAAALHLHERARLVRHHLHQELTHAGFEEAGALAEELHDLERRHEEAASAAARCARLIARHDLAVAEGETGLADARLVVRKRLHPGVTITFGNHRLEITEPAGPSVFRLIDGEVRRE
jgi:uncharacterized protein (DUF342 family)